MVWQETQFFTKIADAFGSVFRKEVKTPLSFFFRLVAAIVVLIAIGVFTMSHSVDGDMRRYYLIVVGLLMFSAMFIVVVLFAIFSPRNLVYGETAHRAEWRMQYGTEKLTLTPDQIAVLPGVQNRSQLLSDSVDPE